MTKSPRSDLLVKLVGEVSPATARNIATAMGDADKLASVGSMLHELIRIGRLLREKIKVEPEAEGVFVYRVNKDYKHKPRKAGKRSSLFTLRDLIGQVRRYPNQGAARHARWCKKPLLETCGLLNSCVNHGWIVKTYNKRRRNMTFHVL